MHVRKVCYGLIYARVDERTCLTAILHSPPSYLGFIIGISQIPCIAKVFRQSRVVCVHDKMLYTHCLVIRQPLDEGFGLQPEMRVCMHVYVCFSVHDQMLRAYIKLTL